MTTHAISLLNKQRTKPQLRKPTLLEGSVHAKLQDFSNSGTTNHGQNRINASRSLVVSSV